MRFVKFLPLVIAIVWNVLDANPTLFFYDKLASFTGGWQHESLQGKTIWITGASSGIGKSLACQVMQAGAAHGTVLEYTIVCVFCCILLMISLLTIWICFCRRHDNLQ